MAQQETNPIRVLLLDARLPVAGQVNDKGRVLWLSAKVRRIIRQGGVR